MCCMVGKRSTILLYYMFWFKEDPQIKESCTLLKWLLTKLITCIGMYSGATVLAFISWAKLLPLGYIQFHWRRSWLSWRKSPSYCVNLVIIPLWNRVCKILLETAPLSPSWSLHCLQWQPSHRPSHCCHKSSEHIMWECRHAYANV